MTKLILASKSPRRQFILREKGYDFEVMTSEYSETTESGPKETAMQNALGKAREVYERVKDKNVVVLGADTIVYFNGKILGKPKSEENAKEMLQSLSNKKHEVYTGYAIITDGQEIVDYDISTVKFMKLSENLIEEYVSSKLPMDKAGAYGIQDKYKTVKRVKGSTYNVIGLPIEKISKVLDKLIK